MNKSRIDKEHIIMKRTCSFTQNKDNNQETFNIM